MPRSIFCFKRNHKSISRLNTSKGSLLKTPQNCILSQQYSMSKSPKLDSIFLRGQEQSKFSTDKRRKLCKIPTHEPHWNVLTDSVPTRDPTPTGAGCMPAIQLLLMTHHVPRIWSKGKIMLSFLVSALISNKYFNAKEKTKSSCDCSYFYTIQKTLKNTKILLYQNINIII